jgi:hypothetical protein
MAEHKVKQQSDVLFHSTVLPAQYASAYPYNFMSTPEAYLGP